MGDANAIANVGQTLVDRLDERLTDPIADPRVELMSPADVEEGSDVRVTLHLYEVAENEHMRNQPAAAPTADAAPTAEPLRLDLHYLLTAYPSDVEDETANTTDQHEMLGRAMQILAELSTIPGAELEGEFRDDETVSVSILPNSTDAAVNVWNTFEQRPYRPSVAYLVTPVVIDPVDDEPIGRVAERDLRYTVPGHGETGEGDGV